MPRVSVLTIVYNGADYILDAIKSVRSQSFGDYEHIIVDDGSSDQTWEILQSQQDQKLKLFRQEKNKGLVATRNHAASQATGEYIAILDHDDTWHPKKLEEQIGIFENNNDASIVASRVRIMDSNSKIIGFKKHLSDSPNDLKVGLLVKNYLTHSSMMLKRGRTNTPMYIAEYPYCEDYFLAATLNQNSSIFIAPEYLTYWRIHDSLSSRKQGQMREYASRVKRNLLQAYGIEFSENEFALHQVFDEENIDNENLLEILPQVGAWLNKLRMQLCTNSSFDSTSVNKITQKIWFDFCSNHWKFGPEIWQAYQKHFNSKSDAILIQKKARLFFKSHAAIFYKH
jgi:glycosyltransferase involved in cell wall biosynthesis